MITPDRTATEIAAMAERDRMLHPPIAWTLEQEAMADLDREALAHMRDL